MKQNYKRDQINGELYSKFLSVKFSKFCLEIYASIKGKRIK